MISQKGNTRNDGRLCVFDGTCGMVVCRVSLSCTQVINADSLCDSFLGFLHALWILGAGQYTIYEISKWLIWIWLVRLWRIDGRTDTA
jgi:hypothetical protein